MFTYQFGYSRSKNYPKALEIANQLGGRMDNGIMKIEIHDYELLHAYEGLLPLISIVHQWKNTKAFYRGKQVDPFTYVFRVWRIVAECAQGRNDTWDERHCWISNDQEGWGCKLMNPFSRHLYGNGKYKKSDRFWYNFGEFEKDDIWKINKKLIFEKLINKAESECYQICPFFSKDKLNKIIDMLPDRLHIDNIHYSIHYNENGEPVNIRHITEPIFPENIIDKVPFYCSN